MRRPEFWEPTTELSTDELRDVLMVACAVVTAAEIEAWTPFERMLAYDWAAREHFAASDNQVQRRPCPSFITRADAGPVSLYRERAHLVAFLAALYPSTIGQDPAQPDWAVVYVQTPHGQLSWHIAPADMDLFGHVELDSEAVWDGHSTVTKYDRLDALTQCPGHHPNAVRLSELQALAEEMRSYFSQTSDGYRARTGQVTIAKWQRILAGQP